MEQWNSSVSCCSLWSSNLHLRAPSQLQRHSKRRRAYTIAEVGTCLALYKAESGWERHREWFWKMISGLPTVCFHSRTNTIPNVVFGSAETLKGQIAADYKFRKLKMKNTQSLGICKQLKANLDQVVFFLLLTLRQLQSVFLPFHCWQPHRRIRHSEAVFVSDCANGFSAALSKHHQTQLSFTKLTLKCLWR